MATRPDRHHLRVISGESLSLEAEAAELASGLRQRMVQYPPGSNARLQIEATLGRYWEALAARGDLTSRA